MKVTYGKFINIILYMNIILLLFIILNINANNSIIYRSTNNANNKIYYGDILKDHILEDILDNEIIIKKHSKCYKLLIVNKIPYKYSVNIDNLINTIYLRKNIECNNVKFISLFVGDEYNSIDEQIANITSNYNIYIAFTDEKFVEKYYYLRSYKCGYLILIDQNNVVRLASNMLDNDTIIRIINNELK